MTIEILKDLQDCTPINGFPNEPISDQEINILEIQYNNGKSFPATLRELLSIAGKYCCLVERGMAETQQQLQDRGIRLLNLSNLSISRPYFVIDLGTDDFAFVYLDEDPVDPILYCFTPENDIPGAPFYSLEVTLSEFINSRFGIEEKRSYPVLINGLRLPYFPSLSNS